MSVRSDIYDVLIVGGGPAGSCAAIQLAARGARVLLAERESFPRAKLCGEFISPECSEHFKRLGVCEEIEAAGGARVRETVFYTRTGKSVRVPSEWFTGGAVAALGLSRAEMDERLLRRARAVGVEVVEDAQAVGVVSERGKVYGVRLSRGGRTEERRARLTIDATGRARVLARFVERAHARAVVRRAPFVAFKSHLEGARGTAGACEIYFYKGGYGGLSPVEGGLSNLCFIARAADVKKHGSDAARVMREVLMRNARAANTLSEARAVGPWLSVALEGFGRRDAAPARGMLAVGDAASFIDPFTGSGMLMALESGELAAACVARWLEAEGEGSASPFENLAREYRHHYETQFGARLRLCGWLRRAAFAPHALAELAVFSLNASVRLRRSLARATRGRAFSISSR